MIKHVLIAAFVFVVTWQEYALKRPSICDGNWTFECFDKENSQPATVEVVEYSIKLEEKRDVRLFIGYDYWDKSFVGNGGIIGPGAFKIKVEEKP